MNYPYMMNYPRMDTNQMQPMQAVQPMQNAQPMQPSFTTRQVTSREEAVAVQADVFGLGTIMPDLAHGVIYLKRFNQNTGGSDFLTFALREEPKQPDAQDVNKAIARLQDEVQRIKELMNYDQSYYGPRASRERRAEPQADDTADGEAEPPRRSVRTNDERQERRRAAQHDDEYGSGEGY